MVKRITQDCDFQTKYITNAEFIPSDVDAMKIVTYKFNVDEPQENERYDMIMGRDILSDLQIDFCLSDYIIRGNRGAYEVCMDSMK